MGEVADDPLAGWTIGRVPVREWIADASTEKVHGRLVRALDRYGIEHPYVEALVDRVHLDPHSVLAQHFPRKAARLAVEYRERGEDPRADRLQAALVALLYCECCGRPLTDPTSVERGVGPDCWGRIAPAWRSAVEMRMARSGGVDHG